MSFRNRIVVAGLVLTLLAPVAGWAKITDRDPDGQAIRVAEVPIDSSYGAHPGVDGAVAAVRTEPSTPRDGIASFLDRFQDWLRGLFVLSL